MSTLSDGWTPKKHWSRFSKIVMDLLIGIDRAKWYARRRWGDGIFASPPVIPQMTPRERGIFDDYMKVLKRMEDGHEAMK